MLSLMLILTPVIVILTMKIWLLMWVCMEINTVGFIYWMMNKHSKESMIKFFIFQSFASIVLLMSFLENKTNINTNSVTGVEKTLFWLAMWVKIGLFPFHMWPMEISKMITWMNNLILMTWQKITPLIFMMKNLMSSVTLWGLLMSMAGMSMVLFYSSFLKVLIMMSSLIHTIWMVLPTYIMNWATMTYFLSYSLMIIMLMKIVSKNTNIKKPLSKNNYSTNIMVVLMLSLAGIPPMLGFLIKMISLLSLMSVKTNFALIVSMTMMASLSFYVYMTMSSELLLVSKNQSHQKTFYNKTYLMLVLFLLTPMVLPLQL